MTAEQSVYEALSGASGVVALTDSRIFPDEAPAGVILPYLVYQRISTDPDVTHDQHEESASRLDGCRLQITAVAATHLACSSIIYQCRLALERTAALKTIWLDERSVGREDGTDANGRQADFLVWKDPD